MPPYGLVPHETNCGLPSMYALMCRVSMHGKKLARALMPSSPRASFHYTVCQKKDGCFPQRKLSDVCLFCRVCVTAPYTPFCSSS